jgi:hypothetical protein
MNDIFVCSYEKCFTLTARLSAHGQGTAFLFALSQGKFRKEVGIKAVKLSKEQYVRRQRQFHPLYLRRLLFL